MLFSFSSSSFHSSFPHLPTTSLFSTCETYAVWLIWQLCCVHCPVNVHICFCHSSSLCVPSSRLMSLMMINLIFSVFAQFVLAASLLPHPTPTSPAPSAYLPRSGHPNFTCASLLSCITIIIVHRPSLNPVELVFPPSLSVCFAEHLWHPPESLGQSRIHAEHVTSSPDSRQLWGVCVLTTLT